MEGDEDSPPRYQPKQVNMPEIDDSESDYETQMMHHAIANKAQMQNYNHLREDPKSETSEELDI